MAMIGKLYLILSFILFSCAAFADELIAEPSSTEIGKSENFSIDFTIRITGNEDEIGDVQFSAPDFEKVNVFSRGQSSESSVTYDSVHGQRVVSTFTQMMTAVLLPKKTGRLFIKNISVKVGKNLLKAPDIAIDVKDVAITQRSQPPTGQGGGIGGFYGRGLKVQNEPGKNNFFLKTETNKQTAYKGEQIVLTYSLYTRAQIMGTQVERYPTVPGFLKEELDVPVLRSDLRYSPAVVNGKEYHRAVLAQYAVYPLKEGKLEIDPFVGKFTYQASVRTTMDDDPFQIFNSFLQSMRAITDTKSSDRVTIDVLPLPASGQPAHFTGLVGDFDISVSADKTSLKVGDSLNVKVKIEGSGHLGSLEKLQVPWPSDFELYEDKANTQFQKTGYSDRVFDYLLIPKSKGHFTIPAIEISMFNPQSKTYIVRHSNPISIEVGEGSLGSIYQAKSGIGQDVSTKEKEDIRYWIDSLEVAGRSKKVWKSIVFVFGLSLIFLFYAILVRTGLIQKMVQQSEKNKKNQLKKEFEIAMNSNLKPEDFAKEIQRIVSIFIQSSFGVSLGSITRSELVEFLTQEKRIPEDQTKKLLEILENCENYRYSHMESDRGKLQEAKNELRHLVDKLF